MRFNLVFRNTGNISHSSSNHSHGIILHVKAGADPAASLVYEALRTSVTQFPPTPTLTPTHPSLHGVCSQSPVRRRKGRRRGSGTAWRPPYASSLCVRATCEYNHIQIKMLEQLHEQKFGHPQTFGPSRMFLLKIPFHIYFILAQMLIVGRNGSEHNFTRSKWQVR